MDKIEVINHSVLEGKSTFKKAKTIMNSPIKPIVNPVF